MTSLKPLRILHVDTEWTWRGGERQIILLAREQHNLGHTPIIVGQPGSPLLVEAQAVGLQTRPLPMRGEWDVFAARSLAVSLRELAIDLIHLHSSHAHALGLLATLIEPRPTVVHRRVDFPVGRSRLARMKYGARVDCFIAVSQAIADILQQGGVPEERICVVHSAATPPAGTPDLDALRTELELRPEDRPIGVVAHLADHKGHRYLIEALPSVLEVFPRAKLLLVGEGKLRNRLERQVGELGLSARVTFTGFRREATSIIRLFELFVLPSHMEGLGSSLMDALWLECPIVATNTGGIPEVVGEGSALLVPPHNPAALASAIIEILSDPARAKARAAHGLGRVQKFNVQAMAEKTGTAYGIAVARFLRREDK